MSAELPHDLDSLEGFERLYRAYYGYAWTVLVRLGVPPAVVDDAHQDVFVTAYRRRDTFERGRPVKPWLVGIARRVAFRYRRSQQRTDRKQSALVHAGGRERSAVASVHARVEAGQFLQAFIEELEPDQREVFILGEIEGYSGPEIAERLAINVNTAYTRLRTARGQLRRALREVEERRVPEARVERGLVLVLPRLMEPGPLAGLWALLVKAKAGVIAGVAGAGVAAAVVVGGGVQPGATKGEGAGDRVAVVRRDVERSTGAGASLGSVEEPPVVAVVPEGAGVVDAARPEPVHVPDDVTAASNAPLGGSYEASDASAASRARSDPPASAARSEAEPREVPAADARPTNAGTEADLQREVDQLTSAREALAAGRPAEALALIEAHARAHPSSSLAEARDALRIGSLCALGRREQARREAAALLRRHPDSALAHHAAARCDEPAAEATAPPTPASGR